MYVCRLRNANGEWVARSANQVDGNSIPIVAPMPNTFSSIPLSSTPDKRLNFIINSFSRTEYS